MTISEAEAQELHALISSITAGLTSEKAHVRALELAAIVLSDAIDLEEPADPEFFAEAQARNERRVKAREENPKLTVYDTGEMFEPKVWLDQSGYVDFDNDESATEFTMFAHESMLQPDTTVIQIDTLCSQRMKILVGDAVVFNGDVQ